MYNITKSATVTTGGVRFGIRVSFCKEMEIIVRSSGMTIPLQEPIGFITPFCDTKKMCDALVILVGRMLCLDKSCPCSSRDINRCRLRSNENKAYPLCTSLAKSLPLVNCFSQDQNSVKMCKTCRYAANMQLCSGHISYKRPKLFGYILLLLI